MGDWLRSKNRLQLAGYVSAAAAAVVLSLSFLVTPAHANSRPTSGLASLACTASGWRLSPSLSPGTTSNGFSSIAATGGVVWAVGSMQQSTGGPRPLAEMFNGTSWTDTAVPTLMGLGELYGVSALGADDVWAVGMQAGASSGETLIVHWDGTQWSPVKSPNPSGAPMSILTSAAAVTQSDVWTVGYYYNSSGNQAQLIEHWDGSAWTIISGAPLNTTTSNLDGIAVISGTDIWVVGSYDYGALTEHWDGSNWSQVDILNTIGDSGSLSGVATSAGSVWAAGNYYTSSGTATLVLRWNGSVWSEVPSANMGSLGSGLSAIAVSSSGDVWAVGWYFMSSGVGDTHALVEHETGTGFAAVTEGTAPTQNGILNGASMAWNGTVWAVGGLGKSQNTTQTLAESYNTFAPEGAAPLGHGMPPSTTPRFFCRP